MPTLNIKYNNVATAVTCTLNSLAASATVGRQSTVIDNTSNLYDDAEFTVVIATSSSSLSAPNVVNVYVAALGDSTNSDQDSAVMGASDASYTIDSPTNLTQLRPINCSTASKTYNRTYRVAAAFDGVMPNKWVIVIVNNTGQALSSSGNSITYTGITYTNA